MMKNKLMLDSWHDLERFGIEPLTGEACALGMRTLCDISPVGVELMESFFGIRFAHGNNSWNHSGKDGWKSIMLPRDLFPSVAKFALIYIENCYAAVFVDYRSPNGVWRSYYVQGFETKEEWDEWRLRCDKIYDGNWHAVFGTGNGKNGTRYQHYMSGRTE